MLSSSGELSSTNMMPNGNRLTTELSMDVNRMSGTASPPVWRDQTQPAELVAVPPTHRLLGPQDLGRLAAMCANLPSFIISDRIVCGRSEKADISFEKLKFHFAAWYDIVSKEQFIIQRNADRHGTQAVIIDKSTNGTFINNERLIKNDEYELCYGDCISIGKPECLAFVFCKISESGLVHSLNHKYIVLPVSLGKGGYGKVLLCRAESDVQTRYAVKQLDKKQLGSYSRHASSTEVIKRELAVLMSTSHPNIMHCFDFIEHDASAYLILEYCSGGEFYDFIVDPKWQWMGLGDNIGRFYAFQLLKGVAYLHANNICHRNIKPENILLHTKGDFVLVKLTNFGLAKRFDLDTMKSNVGTDMYQAPEIGRGYIDEYGPYKSKVDIWSLGCVFFTSFVGYPPFSPDFDDMPAKEQIHTGRLKFLHHWKYISADTQSSVQKMLNVNPSIRPSAEELLALPWMDVKSCSSARRAHDLLQKNKKACSIAAASSFAVRFERECSM